MSSLMYGALTQRRVSAPEDEPLQVGTEIAEADQGDENAVTGGTGGSGGEPEAPSPIVGHITDVLVALVPAEVLALHAVAMSFGTMTTGSGENAITVITRPVEMRVVFGVLMILAFVLYFAGAKAFSWAHVIRALIAALAFVLWTMLQPSTAFDAFQFGLSPLVRTMIPLVVGVILALVVNWLATVADKS